MASRTPSQKLIPASDKNATAGGDQYYLTSSSGKAEQDRLDSQHKLWVAWLDGSLFRAPIPSSIHSVLDVGCGSGAWTLDVAKQYPSAEVLGIDLTPPQDLAGAPRNCHFAKANMEHDWTFLPPNDDKHFDFIYARMLANGMHDWPRFLAQCFTHLRPGGWLEIPDIRAAGLCAKNSSNPSDSPALQWFALFQSAAVRTGIDPYANDKHTQRLHEAGFVNVEERPVEWLVGGASGATEKERWIGDVHLGVIHTLIAGVTGSLLRHEPGVDAGEVQALAERAKEDLSRNQAWRGFYMHLSYHIAQKPEGSS